MDGTLMDAHRIEQEKTKQAGLILQRQASTREMKGHRLEEILVVQGPQ
jgi:hypothetical protein